MYIAIVRAPIPEGMTREKYQANVKKGCERFRTMPGLIRKNYIFSEEQGKAGGIYFWKTREAGEACYKPGGPWRENFTKAFGSEPEILFFECPCVVDNAIGEILTAA